nr:histidine kinase dimerization/phospho-acceptor domain-containing protein [Porphyrobacter sp. GA68]
MSDDRGRIVWTDETVAPKVVGTPLDDVFAGAIIPAAGSPAFRLANRLPLRAADAQMSGAEPIAGRWVVDAVPQFAPASGSFTGYAGRFCRPADAAPDPRGKAREQADALRQVLHELRTPVSAIQGYAELIQQQMVGPVPHAYRALAAGISGDAARILAAFADLEQLARLESNEPGIKDGDRSDLSPIVAATVRQLRPALQPQAAGFDLIIQAGGARVPLPDSDAELLVWRLLASLAASAGEQEIMEVQLEQHGTALDLSCALPATLRAMDDLFVNELPTGPAPVTPGLFGSGFALRLARAQSRAVGGDLRRSGDRLLLTLPVAPETGSGRSNSNAA